MHSKAMDSDRISAVLAKVRETELKNSNQLSFLHLCKQHAPQLQHAAFASVLHPLANSKTTDLNILLELSTVGDDDDAARPAVR